MEQPKTTYRTSDTSLSAFLITSQFALISIDYSSPRYEFLFTDSQEIRHAATDYVSGNARVEPSAFTRVNRKLLRVVRKQCQWEED